MSALVRKEIRLLFPTWLVALVLTLWPGLLSWLAPNLNPAYMTVPMVASGVLAFVLALGSFGREFAHGMFPSLMALPVPRTRLWWTKVSVLAFALATLYGAWWTSFSICATQRPSLWRFAVGSDLTPISTGLFALAIFAGGLWTTLLLRQVAAALWFALLLPGALIAITSVIVDRFTGEPRPHYIAMATVIFVYGIAGFDVARRLFMRAEDAHWTGGDLALPKWLTPSAADPAEQKISRRVRRPFMALVRKELRLQLPLFVMAGLLFPIHLGVVAIRHFAGDLVRQPIVDVLVGAFWALWFVVPLLISATAIAEERKLGILEGQLCQPVGWQKQWRIKFAIVMLLSIFFGTLPPCLLEGTSQVPGHLPSFFFHPDTWYSWVGSIGTWITMAAISGMIALVGLHSSSLSRNIFQALGISIATLTVGSFFISVLDYPESVLGPGFWRGNLGFLFGWPIIVVTLVLLTKANYHRPTVTRREWIRTLSTLVLVVVGIIALATVVYNRSWERFCKTDPPHGPARLTRSSAPALRFDGRLAALSPGGGFQVFTPTHRFSDTWSTALLGPNPDTWERNGLGSNWQSVAVDYWDATGIRSDGTLWVSETPRPSMIRSTDPRIEPAALIQVGTETNWQQVVRDPTAARSRLLLKSDGTFWRWHATNQGMDHVKIPFNLIPFRQIAPNNMWKSMHSSGQRVFVTRSDGQVWAVNNTIRSGGRRSLDSDPNFHFEYWGALDGIQWRSLSGKNRYDLGVKDDGTLWALGELPWNRHDATDQLGRDADWLAVSGSFQLAIALKQDGSLWKMDFGNWNQPPRITRLGAQSDWLAVASAHDTVFALSADGGIWRWGTYAFRPGWFEMSPSRIPTRIGSVVD